MEWLKDPKNQPIVAAIAAVVILTAGFCAYWFGMRTPPSPAPAADQAQVQQDAAPVDGGAPVDPAADPGASPEPPAPEGAPAPEAAPAAQPEQVQVASLQPMETWRADPFQPIGYKQPAKIKPPKPRIMDFPFMKIPIKFPVGGGKGEKWEKPEQPQPSRRMAGLLLNDRVYAIIEANGVSQVVQPGDYTTDRLALVERIESDKVILKTTDEKPRYITVKMAAAPTVQSAESSSSPETYAPPPTPGAQRRSGPPTVPLGAELPRM